MIPNRYEPLGLHRNPFGCLSPADAAAAAVVEIDPLIANLTGRHAIQIIGRCGRGKTTHLRAIQHSLPNCVYAYIPRWKRRVPIPDGDVVILDEVQRMPLRSRQTVFAAGRPLIIATHWSVAAALKWHGYRVTTIRLNQDRGEVPIGEIIRRRWALAAIDVEKLPLFKIDQISIQYLKRRHGGNVRAMIHYLYDRVEMHLCSAAASISEPSDGKMRIVGPT